MLLTCDIGNTNIKTGLFAENKLIEFQSFHSTRDLILYTKGITFSEIAVSSVVPQKLNEIKKTLDENIKLTEISGSSPFNLKIDYYSIDTLGIDRLCSCEGAFYLYKQSAQYQDYKSSTFLLTIDFGTATTINFIKYPGVFKGGIIAPGIHTMIASLHLGTAQLPQIDIDDYKALIGKSTNESIASGIINSTLGLIERVVNHLTKDYKAEEIKIFITGGNAEALLPYLSFEYIYEKALVLYGVNAVYERM
ncbi:MAG: type III pantothenate kinase [Ignavibacteriaceae bacterium]